MIRIITAIFILVFSLAGFTQNLPGSHEVIRLPAPDLDSVYYEDQLNDMDKSLPWRFGIEQPAGFSVDSHGTWTDLADGGKQWQLAIQSEGAVSLSINFDEFYLPPGSRLRLYSPQTGFSGTYTAAQNPASGKLGTWFMNGDRIEMTYFQEPETGENPEIRIKSIVYGYRSGGNYFGTEGDTGFNQSGICNFDVNCSVGPDFDVKKEVLKKSIALVNMGNGLLCSAVLINNVRADKTPYLLTARHSVQLSDPDFWSLRFNWISPDPVCGTSGESGSHSINFTLSGVEVKAQNSETDFALVRLVEDIPQNWDVAFAGWDNSDSDPDFGVGIHHPKGDIMKICRDNSGARKVSANGVESWLIGGGQNGPGNGWELGTTEAGSSGSPLFNEEGKIIGQLHGGLAGCDGIYSNQEYDLYGRFGVSWESGENPQTRLKDWLDPDNTGQKTMGTLQNMLNIPDIQPAGELKIYPNPSQNTVFIENHRYPNLTYELLNMTGQRIASGNLFNTVNTLEVTPYPEGIYLLRLTDSDSDDSITKKIVVKR